MNQEIDPKKQILSNKKNPQPKMLMLTLKRVKEMFPDMEDIEYKIEKEDTTFYLLGRSHAA